MEPTKPNAQVPSIGRIVLWFVLGSVDNPDHTSITSPAIVTKVFEPDNPYSRLGLTVFRDYPDLTPDQQSVVIPASVQYIEANYGEDVTACWAWPPYVAPVRA